MRAIWTIAGCAVLVGGCTVVDSATRTGAGTGATRTLDPTKVYLGAFDEIRTSRYEVDQYECLSGSPLLCRIFGASVECWCAH